MLRRYFLLDGYEVITATGGQEALQKLARKPDIILLDINMPDIDGRKRRSRFSFSGKGSRLCAAVR